MKERTQNMYDLLYAGQILVDTRATRRQQRIALKRLIKSNLNLRLSKIRQLAKQMKKRLKMQLIQFHRGSNQDKLKRILMISPKQNQMILKRRVTFSPFNNHSSSVVYTFLHLVLVKNEGWQPSYGQVHDLVSIDYSAICVPT